MCKSWQKEQAHNLKWPALLYWCQARQNFRKAGHWGRLRNQRILTKTKRIFSMKSLNLARSLVTKRIHPKLRVICIVLKIKTESVDLLLVSFITTADKVVSLKVSSKDQTSGIGSKDRFISHWWRNGILLSSWQDNSRVSAYSSHSVWYIQPLSTVCHEQAYSFQYFFPSRYVHILPLGNWFYSCYTKSAIHWSDRWPDKVIYVQRKTENFQPGVTIVFVFRK